MSLSKNFAYTRPFLFLVALLFAGSVQAQEVADKIIAVVGKNRIILNSELEKQVEQMKLDEPDMDTANDTIRCGLLERMVLSKLLLEQADRDSVFVSEEDVEGQLDNNIRYYIRAYGSKERMEKELGKTIYQIKEEYREIYREQLLAQKMQGQLIQNVKITPGEVKDFFASIPADSLPYVPATVELGQIVIDPPVNEELDQDARQKIEDIRKRIVEGGESFGTLAGIYSNDPGSRDSEGDLGVVGRGDLVPAFSTAAFKLKDGEISQVVKTQYGYHIIQMVKRQGDQAQIRHILIHPAITSVDIKKALNKLDSVRSELVSGQTTFQLAVGKYSTDENSKRSGGMIADPNNGNTQIEIDKLDPGMVLMLDSLKEGSFSQPQVFTNEKGEKSCRIVYVRSRIAPHKVNLKDDYAMIQTQALNQKKMLRLDQWIQEKMPTYYLMIDPQYQTCGTLQKWYKLSAASK